MRVHFTSHFSMLENEKVKPFLYFKGIYLLIVKWTSFLEQFSYGEIGTWTRAKWRKLIDKVKLKKYNWIKSDRLIWMHTHTSTHKHTHTRSHTLSYTHTQTHTYTLSLKHVYAHTNTLSVALMFDRLIQVHDGGDLNLILKLLFINMLSFSIGNIIELVNSIKLRLNRFCSIQLVS